ncbi:hypothetical protein [Methylomicrobium lacus]|uniref:hypothetical protein n=1 Tax=Methylomicrobium lacus TaxID=136992 RepID=UPI002480150F|nr:hypothetical protein [Methylomicrobium lacus]
MSYLENESYRMDECNLNDESPSPQQGDTALRLSNDLAIETVAVIGLGYVGLPLVVELGKHFRTVGFDIAESKVESCK